SNASGHVPAVSLEAPRLDECRSVTPGDVSPPSLRGGCRVCGPAVKEQVAEQFHLSLNDRLAGGIVMEAETLATGDGSVVGEDDAARLRVEVLQLQAGLLTVGDEVARDKDVHHGAVNPDAAHHLVHPVLQDANVPGGG